MTRSDREVVDQLLELYDESYSGKEGQRFLISREDLRSLYGFRRLFDSRVVRLIEEAAVSGLFLWDLGQGEKGYLIAVIKISTVERWRKVPRKVIEEHRPPVSSDGDESAEEDDDC